MAPFVTESLLAATPVPDKRSSNADLELAPIGNCQVSALVDRTGAFVWGCIPRVDGEPVFCSLLNGERRDDGIWRFELEGQVSATQQYIRNTPILLTKLVSKDGSEVEILDFCPRFEGTARRSPQPPGAQIMSVFCADRRHCASPRMLRSDTSRKVIFFGSKMTRIFFLDQTSPS